jgi:hypothetical protein
MAWYYYLLWCCQELKKLRAGLLQSCPLCSLIHQQCLNQCLLQYVFHMRSRKWALEVVLCPLPVKNGQYGNKERQEMQMIQGLVTSSQVRGMKSVLQYLC